VGGVVSTAALALAGGVWLQLGSTGALANAPGHRLLPTEPASVAQAAWPGPSASSASALPDSDFDKACVHLVQQRLYREALTPCKGFLGSRSLGGKAHAVLSAIYSTRVMQNDTLAVQHARQAVQAGDARGKFLLAAHGLAGRAEGVGVNQARALLRDAAAQGVSGAQMYLDALAARDHCMQTTDVRPMGLPLFCMFRGEALQALAAQGGRLKQVEPRLWVDRFQLNGQLAQASEAELAYDLSPTEELHRPARWQILFSAAGDTESRQSQLRAALQLRYGPPAQQQPGLTTWQRPDGMQIRLTNDEEAGLRLVYEQQQAVLRREQHLDQARRQEQSDLQLAEARAL
jgi:TPR repeat protein